LNESLLVDEEEINLEVWYASHTLQGLGCLIWQKIDKPLSTVLSIRRPWFGHLVDDFLSYLL
jgi:hypothetical protein